MQSQDMKLLLNPVISRRGDLVAALFKYVYNFFWLFTISPLLKKKVKPKGSAVSDHLLLCNHSLSFESFSVLNKGNGKFVLELKESLLIMRDKPSLKRNIRSTSLCLFDRVYLQFNSFFGEFSSRILIRF